MVQTPLTSLNMMMKSKPLKVLGFDPSLTNWGFSIGLLEDGLTIIETGVLQHKPNKADKRKQNLKDYDRCKELYTQIQELAKDCDLLCVELPHGSQSSRAMVSYAVCVALTATLNIDTVIVTPFEVKRFVGSNTASKDDVINWAKQRHPQLNLSIKSKAEHIADSIVAMYVGLTKRELL